MDLYDRIRARGWLDRIHSEFSEDEILELHKVYFKTGITNDFKPRTHGAICTRAFTLAEHIQALNGAKEDIHLAIEYLLICLDCQKYRLDWRKYREDRGIRNLEKKYSLYA